MRTNRRRPSRARSALVAVGVLALTALLTACLPVEPAAGRATPVRRVLVLGDSMTFGLFGTTPQVHPRLTRLMADRGIALRIDGFPGENPIDVWPGTGHPTWLARMQYWIAAEDPDVVIIQSVLFPDPDDESRRAAYLQTMGALIDTARSRGAHVYIVSHPSAPGWEERHARDVAQVLQAQAAAGKGVSTIPLDWWLDRCAGAYVSDGWHLSGKGQDCHALAVALAIDQLRQRTG